MTAKVITVFNQKGGCGKTTMTMQLAASLSLRGFSVLVVDMDPQGTATRWASAGAEGVGFPAAVISLAPMEGRMHREVKNHMEAYDFIFIDCPPSMNSAVPTSAMLISDLAVIPVIPSPGDIWAAEGAKRLTEVAQASNATLIARVAPNMVQRQTKLAKDLLEILNEDPDIKVFTSHLGSRTAYRECQIMGTSVHRVSGSQAAVMEVEALATEVLSLLGVKPAKGLKK